MSKRIVAVALAAVAAFGIGGTSHARATEECRTACLLCFPWGCDGCVDYYVTGDRYIIC